MSNSRQKALETLLLAVGNVILGAASGYQRFHMLTGVLPGVLVSGVWFLWINWDSVQFAIRADQRAVGRPFWPTAILAAQAFLFFSVVSLALQMPGFLLVSWLRR
jgi:hypothetical protein